jgi:N-acetylglucosamine-6-phosphate deacetylase
VTTTTTVLSGADLVLPDRVLSPGSLVLEGSRIVDIAAGARAASDGETFYDLTGHLVVPGFIDVHVHGLEGHDTQVGDDGIDAMARRLPRYGVTGFCPTTIACSPEVLTRTLAAARLARSAPPAGAARVLPAHLESNFINPDYRGAQPLDCIRRPPGPQTARPPRSRRGTAEDDAAAAAVDETGFTGADIVAVIAAYRAEVGIVTIAPEMPNAIALIRALTSAGHRASLGHSGATYAEALAGIEAGACHATHLFNRMTPLGHREPGLTGAVLHADALAAEIVCDGYHVHPSVMRLAIDLKQPQRMMAITDGTAGAGLPVGTRVSIGGRPITVTASAAFLDDGTLAGSVLTMDGAFRTLVNAVGLGVVEAAIMCATTPARELKLEGRGAIAAGAFADLVVLNRGFEVVRTFIDGESAYPL